MNWKTLIAGLTLYATGGLCAATYTFVDGASDWTSGDSYKGKVAPQVGESGVVLQIPADVTVRPTAASIAFANSLSADIWPIKPSSRMVVDVAQGAEPLWLTAKFSSSAHGQEYYSKKNGVLVKTGAGVLVVSNGTSDVNLHSSCFEVREGTLEFACNSGVKPIYGEASVSNNATLVLPKQAGYVNILGLWGEGLVTTKDGAAVTLRVGDAGAYSEFDGVLDSAVYYFSAGRCCLKGANKTTRPITTYNAKDGLTVVETGIGSFPATVGAPSPVGTVGLLSADTGGGFIYCGANDELVTTDVKYGMYPVAPYYSTFDAGTNGNVRFTGDWFTADEKFLLKTSYSVNGRLCLAGSNLVHECSLANKWLFDWTHNDVDHTYEILKIGPGIWRAENTEKWNSTRKFSGPVVIREGTLRADSLYGIGLNSSLGNATRLGGSAALTLGGEGTEGTLEYSGNGISNGICAVDRPIALVGDGRLLNDSSVVPIRYRGATSISAASKTLTLDGSSKLENTFADIVDDDQGAIGVTKKGVGTWYLTGTNSFHGPLVVEAGKLVVRNVATDVFKWFRWTIRHAGSSTGAAIAQAQEFALYDANGSRQNSAPTIASNYIALQPGQAAYGRFASYFEDQGNLKLAGVHRLARLFDNRLNYDDAADSSSTYRQGWAVRPRNDAGTDNVSIKESDSNSWVSVVMRLADSAAPITGYDISASSDGGSYFPRSWILEGSVDGLHWLTLSDKNDAVYPGTWKWWHSKTAADQADGKIRTNTDGEPIAGNDADAVWPMLNNVASVSVAAGATLEIGGPAIAVSHVTLNAAGAGTFKNFVFPENGTIDVTGLDPKAQTTTIRPTYEGCDPSNMTGWSLTIDGQAPKKHSYAINEDGSVTIQKNGMMILLR